jgi:hypothetical protein
VHVEHLPRMSTPAARMADRLSRSSTTRWADRTAIRRAMRPTVKGALLRWLEKPCTDWQLPVELLRDVQDTIRSHH